MSFLQPITRSLPDFIREPVEAIIGEECYDILIYNTDFAHERCLKLAFSKVLSTGLVAGGAIVKVPQIFKILGSKSARGLSMASYVLDTANLGITVAYNLRKAFPFSTYGENAFLLGQNFIIIFLMIIFSSTKSFAKLVVFFSIFAVSGYALFSPGFLSDDLLETFAVAAIPLSITSKVPQVLSNGFNRSTGQLSSFLVYSSLAGCLARVFTTSTETQDPILFWGFVGGVVLNAVLALQLFVYRNNTGEKAIPPNTYHEKSELPTIANRPQSVVTPIKKRDVSRGESPATGRKYVRKLD